MLKLAALTIKPEADSLAEVERMRAAHEYIAFLQRKVDAARASLAAGEGRSDEDVEGDFGVRRASLIHLAKGRHGN